MKRYQPKNYEIRVWWSEEDESFLAQVLDLPGIMTHGKTPEDAARENYAALQLALDSLNEAGQEAPAPESRAGFHASSVGVSH